MHVVGFDEDESTLQAIVDGTCYGTVVQNPYQYGYQSVKVLAENALGTTPISSLDKFIDIPARQIKRDNVEEFWAELKKLTGKTDEGSEDQSEEELEEEEETAEDSAE